MTPFPARVSNESADVRGMRQTRGHICRILGVQKEHALRLWHFFAEHEPMVVLIRRDSQLHRNSGDSFAIITVDRAPEQVDKKTASS